MAGVESSMKPIMCDITCQIGHTGCRPICPDPPNTKNITLAMSHRAGANTITGKYKQMPALRDIHPTLFKAGCSMSVGEMNVCNADALKRYRLRVGLTPCLKIHLKSTT
eukprot:4284575-Pleurochrysis_carterae.AAC.2